MLHNHPLEARTPAEMDDAPLTAFHAAKGREMVPYGGNVLHGVKFSVVLVIFADKYRIWSTISVRPNGGLREA
jgi:hypothetical protein